MKICFWPELREIDYSLEKQRISGYEIILERILKSFKNQAKITGLPDYPLFQVPFEEIEEKLEAADIIVAQNFTATCNLLVFKFIKQLNKPCFFALYNNPYAFFSLKILGLLLFSFNSADHFITGTETVGRLYRLINNKIGLYPSLLAGIEPPANLAIKKEPNFFTYLGRIHPEKDILSIFKVLEKFKEKKIKFSLHLVGQIEDENYYSALKIYLENSTIKNDIVWHGRVAPEKLAGILAKTDVFLSFSINKGEILGLTPLEAMSYGAIPVLSNWNGYREIIFDQNFLVPVDRLDTEDAPGNVYCVNASEALKKIIKIIELPAAQKEKLRLNCRLRAADFTSEKLARNFLAFAEKICPPPPEPLFDLENLKIKDLEQFMAGEIFLKIFPADLFNFKIKEVLFNPKLLAGFLKYALSRQEEKKLEDFLLKPFYS